MKVALTMRTVDAVGYSEPRDAISHDWMRWLASQSYTPVLLPNAIPDPSAFLEEQGAEAIILTGGNDAVARPDGSGDFDPLRNRTEFSAIEWAIEKGRPVLGVCRGMHMINLYFGGSMEAEIPVGHVATVHRIDVEEKYRPVYGDEDGIETNSFHGQGIRPGQLADDLDMIACSADGLVEAAAHTSLPIFGIQWHPERPNPSAEFDSVHARQLFEEGVFWK